MSLIENLNWRHAVKAFDPNKKVSEENIEKIIEAARLAPTSSGLQQFRVISISNQEVKEKLVQGALNPDSMKDCSHVLVFAAWDNYTAERIDKVFDYTTDERGLPRGRFSSYTDMLKKVYLDLPDEVNFAHTSRQTYIALGLALAQAAELKVDTCPAEGFDNKVVDEVLELDKMGLKSVSLMYIGYADDEKDWIKPMKKVRIPRDEFVIDVK
ncbi:MULTISPECIES: nitroreductase family protein [Tenacibaculum]|uniref:NAD(P)H-dependent oxidoreductase n=1 Tax=Tenacibaculum discolor TaxID=361581 RepID=A0A2G1BYB6_9FLAO|nr:MULTISPECIES: nitroreductase family protein [Tenacibaculum]PHO01027.1 NAD(P)H-dependent oxidoreductase [Rhodobacteraceae bacterium 4F10]MDP2541298.1 nitroreductase family protein [Tenacibaculum discolor]NVK10245.1 nitroreductase family protein [Tenacibaculum sp.]PHN98994.1 NAD(P)H-dependent oxidoreductase [Tenacibaculum discolor]RLJ97885.1 nitroreductase [Tenacibaculum discolor]